MAFSQVYDVDLKILEYLEIEFRLVISLSTLDWSSHQFMKTTIIYQELIKLKNEIGIPLEDFENDELSKWDTIKYLCKFDLFKLFQIKLIFYVNNNIALKEMTMIFAAKYGRVRFLRFMEKICVDIKKLYWIDDAINAASKNGHVCVLEWLQKNEIYQASKISIVYASLMGHVHVIEWLMKNNRYIKKNDSLRIGFSEQFRNPRLCNCFVFYFFLDFSKNHRERKSCHSRKKIDFGCFRFPKNYLKRSVVIACCNGHINVLEWFKKSDIRIFDFGVAIDLACENGHIKVLDWFRRNGYIIEYNGYAINMACRNGHINVLVWFMDYGLKFIYTKLAIAFACIYGHLAILKFFWRHNIPFKYHRCTIEMTVENGHRHILEWLTKKSYRLNFIVPENKIEIFMFNHNDIHLIRKLKMALTKVYDVDLKILEYLETDFSLVISLSILNKSSNRFMKITVIYQELMKFRNNIKSKYFTTDNSTMVKYSCKMNLPKLFRIKSTANSCTLETAMIQAAKYNRINFLNLIKNVIIDYKIHKNEIKIAINKASKYGHVTVLEWFQKNEMYYHSNKSIICASSNGHDRILEWCIKNNYHIKIFRYGFCPCCDEFDYPNYFYKEQELCHSRIRIHTICKFPCECLEKSIAIACYNGHINVLEWFKKSELGFKNSYYTIDLACENGHLKVIEWFLHNGFDLRYTDNAVDFACRNGHMYILMWFVDSGYEFLYSEYAIAFACKYGHLKVLKFFRKHNLPFMYHKDTIGATLGNDHYHILDWITKKSYKLNYIVPKLKN